MLSDPIDWIARRIVFYRAAFLNNTLPRAQGIATARVQTNRSPGVTLRPTQ